MSKRSTRRVVAGLAALALVAGACGSDSATESVEDAADDVVSDVEDGADDVADAAEDVADDAAGAAEDVADEVEDVADDAVDDVEDVVDGDSGDAPSGEATGEPIKIGVQNLEGDPNGSFPEYSLAIQAASDYINAELDGLGGRPIEIELCKSVVSPDDSQRCANELAADGVELALSTLNFFGNHFSIYQGSDIPVIVGTPITLADFTAEGVFSIGAGGGCLGVHTGLVQFATGEIEALEEITVNKVAVPWADTPPGVVCYNDLEAKPLDVLNGTTPGESARAGEKPELTYVGVPILPASADVTPQATEVLDFDPDVIIYSAQGADCWNFVNALGRLGWNPEETPLVLSGACTDFDALAAAGDLSKGIYLTSTENGLLSPLDGLEGQHLDNASTFQTKAPEYGMPEDLLFTGFATAGFGMMMNIWQMAQTVDGEVTGQKIADAFASTDGSLPAFGGSPLDCSNAPAPYVAVCSAPITVTQWDGTQLNQIGGTINAIDLVAGTELRPG